MGTEQKVGLMENLGIKVPLGPTVIIASFLSTRDDPLGEHPKIDLTAKNMAVWLTTPKTVRDEVYDFIIAPDGTASAIAIRKSDGQIYFQTSDGLTKIEGVKKIEAATFLNMPDGANTQVIRKVYPQGLWECYAVLTLPGNEDKRNINEFSPFAGRRTLVSGMKNRGLSSLSTFFWASRMTDRRNLPFGRELPKKNNR